MGKQTLLEKFQDAISWYVGWLYLWSLRMTVEEYVSSVIAENAQQNAHLTGLHCPACTSLNEEIVTCARCGTVKSAPQVA